MIGDVNGDGYADRATLTGDIDGSCAVNVELGTGTGGYGPGTTYVWDPDDELFYCPDMGVIVDLGGDGVTEIVLAWWAGKPPGTPYDLVLLEDFTRTGGFDALFQPNEIGLADFNGDGRLDVYEWTDQGSGFESYLNTASGGLVRGPVSYSCLDQTFDLADMDRDGATDLVMACYGGWEGVTSGVVVVFDDGQKLYLQSDIGEFSWQSQILDANGDTKLDVKTTCWETGEVTHFIGNGNGGFAVSPAATNDTVQVPYLGQKTISVLVNDVVTSAVALDIVTPPTYGVIVRTTSKGFIYRNDVKHDDSFVYRLTQDGKTVTATASLRIK